MAVLREKGSNFHKQYVDSTKHPRRRTVVLIIKAVCRALYGPEDIHT